MNYTISYATEKDSSLILDYIIELAKYENLEDQVVATVEQINKTLFCENPKAKVLLLEEDNEDAGFALYFHNYSTFLCKYGIYIEDIYVREKFRNKGYGKAFFKKICEEALKMNCGRVEWWCLDWNKPSIDFYTQKLNAEQMSDWTVYRLNEEKIRIIACEEKL